MAPDHPSNAKNHKTTAATPAYQFLFKVHVAR